MSKVHSYHHIVFSTRLRQTSLNSLNREALYRCIWSETTKMNCHLLRIGGMADHVHILVDIHPTVCIADFVKEIKTSSGFWMKNSGLFPKFSGWNKEYFAESKSPNDIPVIIEYIKNQESHHKTGSFLGEIKGLYERAGLRWDARDYPNEEQC